MESVKGGGLDQRKWVISSILWRAHLFHGAILYSYILATMMQASFPCHDLSLWCLCLAIGLKEWNQTTILDWNLEPEIPLLSCFLRYLLEHQTWTNPSKYVVSGPYPIPSFRNCLILYSVNLVFLNPFVHYYHLKESFILIHVFVWPSTHASLKNKPFLYLCLHVGRWVPCKWVGVRGQLVGVCSHSTMWVLGIGIRSSDWGGKLIYLPNQVPDPPLFTFNVIHCIFAYV